MKLLQLHLPSLLLSPHPECRPLIGRAPQVADVRHPLLWLSARQSIHSASHKRSGESQEQGEEGEEEGMQEAQRESLAQL